MYKIELTGLEATNTRVVYLFHVAPGFLNDFIQNLMGHLSGYLHEKGFCCYIRSLCNNDIAALEFKLIFDKNLSYSELFRLQCLLHRFFNKKQNKLKPPKIKRKVVQAYVQPEVRLMPGLTVRSTSNNRIHMGINDCDYHNGKIITHYIDITFESLKRVYEYYNKSLDEWRSCKELDFNYK